MMSENQNIILFGTERVYLLITVLETYMYLESNESLSCCLRRPHRDVICLGMATDMKYPYARG